MEVLVSNIIIGKYGFKVHEVTIKKSLHSYMDTAIIKIPVSARVQLKDNTITDSMATASYFKEGDKVIIELGYDGELKKEFEGFVSRINFTTPLEIECEGYGYQLRQKSFKGSFKTITVKELVQKLIEGTDIVLDKEMDNATHPMYNEVFNDYKLGILDYLKQKMGCDVYFKKHKYLYVGLKLVQQHAEKGVEVKHTLGWNVIKDNALKERTSSEEMWEAHVSCEKSDGTKQKVTQGNKGGRTMNIKTANTDAATLQLIANNELAKKKFNGYEGKITTFLKPYTEPGDISILASKRFDERFGRYIIESTEVQYGIGGARRINELGVKL